MSTQVPKPELVKESEEEDPDWGLKEMTQDELEEMTKDMEAAIKGLHKELYELKKAKKDFISLGSSSFIINTKKPKLLEGGGRSLVGIFVRKEKE